MRAGQSSVRAAVCWVLGAIAWMGMCAGEAAAVAVPVNVVAERVTELKSWLVFGPFATAKKPATDNDFAAPYGTTEAALGTLSPGQWENLRGVAEAEGCRVTLAARDLPYVDLRRALNLPARTRGGMAVYLVSTLEVAAKRTVWFCVNTDRRPRLWWNGREIVSWRVGANSSAALVPLAAGQNTIVVKLLSVESGADFALVCAPEDDLPAAFETMSALPMLKRHVFAADTANILQAIDPIILSEATAVQLTELATNTTYSLPSPTRLPARPGAYRVDLTWRRRHHSDVVFLAPTAGVSAYFEGRCRKFADQARYGPTLRAYVERLRILEAAAGKSPGRLVVWYETDHKMAWTIQRLNEFLGALERNRNPLGAAGLHLRGFVSAIDGEPQYYRIYMPASRIPWTRVPLMIWMTPRVATNCAFLESPIVAHQEDAERVGHLADQLGVAMLWPGYRNNPCGAPLEFTHLGEVIAAAKREFPVDPNRVALIGWSTAGITTAMAAARAPHAFVGLAFRDAAFHLAHFDPGTPVTEAGSRAYDEYLARSDPIDALARSGIPMHVLHDGSTLHGTLQESLELVQAVRHQGHPVCFEEPGAELSEDAILAREIRWLLGLSSKRAGISASRAEGFESVARCLAAPFVVVVPSLASTDEQREQLGRLGSGFSAAWQSTCFGRCRIVRDVDLTPALRQMNLVLLGNPQSNAEWRRLESQLAVRLDARGIDLDDQHWSGRLNVQAWCYHPSNRNARIILIGSANLQDAVFPSWNVAVDGWYDYQICAVDASGRPEVVAAGHYRSERGERAQGKYHPLTD